MNSTSHKNKPKNKIEFIFLITLLGSIVAIGPLAIDMYIPAFPAIANGLQTIEAKIQLSLTAYFIGMALSQILYGPIVDRFGKRIPLFVGLITFIAASILCAMAKNIEQLIIYRFFQALGGCACIIIPRAIVRDIFSPQESARVFSHLMLVMGIAPIIAPLSGTFVLSFFGWEGIFNFLAIFGIICVALSYKFIPETKIANADDKISKALTKYLIILKDKTFLISALCGGFAMAGLFSYITASAFIYINIFELTPRQFAILFSANSIGFIGLSQFNAKLLKKYPIENLLKKVLFIPLFCGILMIFLGANQPSFLTITILFFVILATIGAIVPNTTALALTNHASRSGSASAMLGTIQFSISTLTSIIVSYLHDGTIFPLCLVFGSCAILAFVVYRVFR